MTREAADDPAEPARMLDIRDRVTALDGPFVIERNETATAVHAEIPCA